MIVTTCSEKVTACLSQLFRDRECVYQAESVEELTEVLEAVSLEMEESRRDFTFSIDGSKVVFQLVGE